MYYLTVFILCPGSDGQLSDWYSEEKSGLMQVAFFQALNVSGNRGGGGGVLWTDLLPYQLLKNNPPAI